MPKELTVGARLCSAPDYAVRGRSLQLRATAVQAFPPGSVLVINTQEWLDHGDVGARVAAARAASFNAPIFFVLPGPQGGDIPCLSTHLRQAGLAGWLNGSKPFAPQLRHALSDPGALQEDAARWLITNSGEDWRIFPEIRALLSSSCTATSVDACLRAHGLSLTTARARLRRRGLPSPAALHSAGLALRCALAHQRDLTLSTQDIAFHFGYADASGVAHLIRRKFGVGISFIRRHIGWEWLWARWLAHLAPSKPQVRAHLR